MLRFLKRDEKLLLSSVFVAAGFVAGLVITGRMRTASDSVAEPLQSSPAAAPASPSHRAGAGPEAAPSAALQISRASPAWR